MVCRSSTSLPSEARAAPGAETSLRQLSVRRLGLVPYGEALEMQQRLVKLRQAGQCADTLLLLEHPPVFTLGRNARREHVLCSEAVLRERGYELHEIGRGGDVTYHGPGQLVAYPILDLSPDRRDVHRYVRDLEEVMIRTCADHAVHAERIRGLSGAWVGAHKIGAVGVRIARWVTSHGIALNVRNDLRPFELIVPCGIRDRGVTSLQHELGHDVAMETVMADLSRHLAEIFERRLVE